MSNEGFTRCAGSACHVGQVTGRGCHGNGPCPLEILHQENLIRVPWLEPVTGTPADEQWNCGNHHLRAQCVAGVIIATMHTAPATDAQTIQMLDDLFLECGAAYCRSLLDSKAFTPLPEEIPF
jgi:hypothetical protein